MVKRARALWRDEGGAELVEWAVLMVVLLSASVFVLIMVLQPEVIEMAKDTFLEMQKAPPTDF